MAKRDQAVARTLQEIKNNDCQHPSADRSVDLDTADRFCVNCGAVTQKYEPGTPGLFPGRLASDLIVEQLKTEILNENVQTRLFSVEPQPGLGDKFYCYMQIHRKGGTEGRYYVLTRLASDDSARVERTK
ncbi:hypothetical protein SEA_DANIELLEIGNACE_47 [Arthrobacter phage DanielleIgnace]|nr:hypothetical protein SEA_DANIELLEIGNACE_47 [Arthrobacter phage DanielleIgnace]